MSITESKKPVDVKSFTVDPHRGVSILAVMGPYGHRLSMAGNGNCALLSGEDEIASVTEGRLGQFDLRFMGVKSPDFGNMVDISEAIQNNDVACVFQDKSYQFIFRWFRHQPEEGGREYLTTITVPQDEAEAVRMMRAGLAAKVLVTDSVEIYAGLRELLVPSFTIRGEINEGVSEVWHEGRLVSGLNRVGSESYALVKKILAGEKEFGVFKIASTWREVVAKGEA